MLVGLVVAYVGLAGGDVAIAQPDGREAQIKQEAMAVVDTNAERIGRLGDAIFSYSEIGFQETKTIKLVTETLSAAGFKVQKGVAGMPTAYMASYGSGAPVIGLMSDFAGGPGTSQKPVSLVHDPLVPGGPGHGEGHSTHQPVLIGAALAFKAVKDKYGIPGTLIVYGGPAEELLASRGYMVNAGLFENVDAIIDAHIGTTLGTSYGLNNLALISAEWTFTGKQAHGARAWQGRSALDAVELMDISTDFMREHMDPPARLHHVVSDGGQQPNVVPATAKTWYYFRHLSAQEVWDLFKRGREAAKGAALQTGTTVSERILSASWPFYGNRKLAELVQANIEEVGMPQWTADDLAFAKAYQKAMGAPVKGLPTKVETLEKASQGYGSSDAGDVTWQAPYVRLRFPSKPDGELAGHHWSAGIAPATPLAHKGMAAASKVLVGSAIDLMTRPEALAAIKQDFAQQLAQFPKWKSLIPPDAKPPIEINTEEMAQYREALKPIEYEPASDRTYLETLGVAYPPAMPGSAIGKASNEITDNAAKTEGGQP